MKKWISVIREDGKEVRFEVRKIYGVKFGLNDISILLADIGWKNSFLFSLPTPSCKKAKEGDFNEWYIVTKEELEKLRIELQNITKEEK